MAQREPRNKTRKDVWDSVGDAFEVLLRTLGRVIKEGNRRQLALRNRDGAVVARLPLTLAVLIALFLLWTAAPLLILLLILAFALRGRVVILRKKTADG